jgi:hypothetical protein
LLENASNKPLQKRICVIEYFPCSSSAETDRICTIRAPYLKGTYAIKAPVKPG